MALDSPKANDSANIIYGPLIGLNTHHCKPCGFFTIVPVMCIYNETDDQGLVLHTTPYFCDKCDYMFIQLYIPRSYADAYLLNEGSIQAMEEELAEPRWGKLKVIATLIQLSRDWWRILDPSLQRIADEHQALESFKGDQAQQKLLDLFKHSPPMIAVAEGDKRRILLPNLPTHVKTPLEEIANPTLQRQNCLRCGGSLTTACPKCSKSEWDAEIISRMIMINDLIGRQFATQDEAMQAMLENQPLVEKIRKKTDLVSGRKK
jgi:hypothetical protein